MKTPIRSRALFGAATLSLLCGVLLPQSSAFAQPSNGVEELTRGPVHEAFAESVSYDPEPGIVIEKSPPEMIEELPPEQRPVGDNISWIPGYWGWEEDRGDFIWISGVWRNIPPGRQWVPGYWDETGSRYQWISGYWSLSEEEEVAYLPEPPRSVERGPSVEAPSDNHIWVSGNWYYEDSRYAWRPGYWEPARQNWVWIPAHYVWTRRGYVFVEGYWDYDVPRRGTIFAPVYFDRAVYSRPGYYYTPLTVIALNIFSSHLFVRPRYSHYYFGDYYDPRYRDSGFYASFSFHRDRRGYDPFYAHDRWFHRGDRDWDRRRRENFEFYRDNRDARPPRTLAALMALPEKDRRGRRDDFELARPLSRMIEDKDSRQRFVKADRKEFAERGKEIREFSRERRQIETRAGSAAAADGDGPKKVVREKIGRSPVVSKKLGDLKDAPPERTVRRDDRSADSNRGNKPEEKNDQRQEKPGSAEMRKEKPAPAETAKKENGRDPKSDERGNNAKKDPSMQERKGGAEPEKRRQQTETPQQRQREPEKVKQQRQEPEKAKRPEPAPQPKKQMERREVKQPETRKVERAPEPRKVERAPEPRKAERSPEPRQQRSEPREQRGGGGGGKSNKSDDGGKGKKN